ncbi:MAG: DNA-3-methyladenine glycosylase [Candidatus Obscuribacterales bacterium]|nr:DNA-3-methyladenine glycosylase [Candidatus Obscuribacterales bacterium]
MATGRKIKISEYLETLPPEFFLRDTVTVARELLGVTLVRRLEDGTVLSGPIVETEAYTQDDPACHAFRGKTPRCSVMFGPGGFAYVYFIYGMYNCLNVVTEAEHTAGAVLIRAIGAEGTNGPGKLCREWSIDRSHNGVNLMDAGSPLWLSKSSSTSSEDVEVSTRIGLSVAQDRPWRFTVRNHPSVSVGGSKRNSKPRVANS